MLMIGLANDSFLMGIDMKFAIISPAQIAEVWVNK